MSEKGKTLHEHEKGVTTEIEPYLYGCDSVGEWSGLGNAHK